jgi:hypothetical protein
METTMPLYFISTTIGNESNIREEPLDLPDDSAAWSEATTACGEIMKDLDGRFPLPGEWRLDVRNERAKPLFSLRILAEKHSPDRD